MSYNIQFMEIIKSMLLQNAYLYSRMYYNKIRDTAYQWWRTYLLFKCCVLVIPIYTGLLLIGLYCILYNIDVQSPLKTIYELMILFFSAAAIFIIVLLLATLNGNYATSMSHLDSDTVMIPASSLSTSRRNRHDDHHDHLQDQRRSTVNNTTSIVSSIMSTLFGSFDDPDDPDYCYDSELDDSSDLLNGTELNLGQTMAQLNAAQSRLMVTMEHTTNSLEYFLEEYQASMNMDENPSPVNGYELDEHGFGSRAQNIIANPLLESSKTLNRFHYPALIPLESPKYSQNEQMAPPPSYNITHSNCSVSELDTHSGNDLSSTYPTYLISFPNSYHDLPPSYEEAIRTDHT